MLRSEASSGGAHLSAARILEDFWIDGVLDKKSVLSLRSRRKHKAWGASPRESNATDFKPAKAGDRTKGGKMLTIGGRRAAAHFMGSQFNLISDPGACAPGFMLPPASQA